MRIKINAKGIQFRVPKRADVTTKDGVTFIYGRPPIAGAFVKQYVKTKYPHIKCSVRSESFSMGNSLDVWISEKNGNPVSDENIVEDVRRFTDSFQYGRFNGMIDMYEYNDNRYAMRSDEGVMVEAACKYVHVTNRERGW